ncbi:MAG: hypothetical protein IPH09_16715 [bacterium]|nr:hypothetical protein [bacterium]
MAKNTTDKYATVLLMFVSVLMMLCAFNTICYAQIGRNYSVYVGSVASEFGGSNTWGISCGVSRYIMHFDDEQVLRIRAGIDKKINVGRVRKINSGTGGTIYDGQAEISLNYITISGEYQHILRSRKVAIAPFVGLGISILNNQNVNTEMPSASAFDEFNWYSNYDLCITIGTDISYRNTYAGIYADVGTVALKSTQHNPEGASTGTPFTDHNERLECVRILIGVAF